MYAYAFKLRYSGKELRVENFDIKKRFFENFLQKCFVENRHWVANTCDES